MCATASLVCCTPRVPAVVMLRVQSADMLSPLTPPRHYWMQFVTSSARAKGRSRAWQTLERRSTRQHPGPKRTCSGNSVCTKITRRFGTALGLGSVKREPVALLRSNSERRPKARQCNKQVDPQSLRYIHASLWLNVRPGNYIGLRMPPVCKAKLPQMFTPPKARDYKLQTQRHGTAHGALAHLYTSK